MIKFFPKYCCSCLKVQPEAKAISDPGIRIHIFRKLSAFHRILDINVHIK